MIPQPNCYIFSRYGTVLLHIAANPDCTIKDLAEKLFLTKRTVWGTIGDLKRADMIHVRKLHRRHYYTINPSCAFYHPTVKDCTLRQLTGGLVS